MNISKVKDQIATFEDTVKIFVDMAIATFPPSVSLAYFSEQFVFFRRVPTSLLFDFLLADVLARPFSKVFDQKD